MATPLEHGAIVAITAPSLALLFTFWPFGLAFIASCVALIYVANTKLNVAVKNVVGSTLIGGSLSQLTSEPVLLMVDNIYPAIHSWAVNGQMPATAILAIAIGLLTQRLLPRWLNRAEKTIDGK